MTVGGKAGGLALAPRRLRVEYPGAIYHIINRRDHRKDIYRDDVDRRDLLKTLAEACQKTGFQIHAYLVYLRGKAALKDQKSENVRKIARFNFGFRVAVKKCDGRKMEAEK